MQISSPSSRPQRTARPTVFAASLGSAVTLIGAIQVAGQEIDSLPVADEAGEDVDLTAPQMTDATHHVYGPTTARSSRTRLPQEIVFGGEDRSLRAVR